MIIISSYEPNRSVESTNSENDMDSSLNLVTDQFKNRTVVNASATTLYLKTTIENHDVFTKLMERPEFMWICFTLILACLCLIAALGNLFIHLYVRNKSCSDICADICEVRSLRIKQQFTSKHKPSFQPITLRRVTM